MTQTISCRAAIERLWGYLDDTLDAEHRDELEAHLSWCLQCCGELEFAGHLRTFLRERATPSMPSDVAARLHRVVDDLLPPDPTVVTDPDGRGPP